jgi:hypothetical protein
MVPIICYLIGFIIIGNTLILLILLLIKYFLKYNFSYIFFIIPGGIIYLISIELYIEFLLYYEEKYVKIKLGRGYSIYEEDININDEDEEEDFDLRIQKNLSKFIIYTIVNYSYVIYNVIILKFIWNYFILKFFVAAVLSIVLGHLAMYPTIVKGYNSAYEKQVGNSILFFASFIILNHYLN